MKLRQNSKFREAASWDVDDIPSGRNAKTILPMAEVYSIGALLLALTTRHEPFENLELADNDEDNPPPLKLCRTGNQIQRGMAVFYSNTKKPHFLNSKKFFKAEHFSLFELIGNMMHQIPTSRPTMEGLILEVEQWRVLLILFKQVFQLI